MKKYLLLLLLAIMAIGANAQEHLKFQGIPVDGSFTQLDQKLKAKGWVYDYNKSKAFPADQRIYKGVFSQFKGEAFVVRSPKSKVVFSICFYATEVANEKIAQQQLATFINSLSSVYPNANVYENNRGEIQFDIENGSILCGILNVGYGLYSSYLNYVDRENSIKALNESNSDY